RLNARAQPAGGSVAAARRPADRSFLPLPSAAGAAPWLGPEKVRGRVCTLAAFVLQSHTRALVLERGERIVRSWGSHPVCLVAVPAAPSVCPRGERCARVHGRLSQEDR